jgi:hypothetical protein
MRDRVLGGCRRGRPALGRGGSLARRLQRAGTGDLGQWLFVREHARVGGDLEALCATFGSSQAAMQRRIETVYG